MNYCKCGWHVGIGGNRTGIGEYFHRLAEANIPAILKSVDDYGVCLECLDANPDNIVVFRMTGGDLELPDYNLPPDIAAQEHWTRIKNALPPEFDKRTWLEVMNEPDKVRADWLGKFATACSGWMISEGYKFAAFGFSTGEPEKTHWETNGMLDFLRLAEVNWDTIAVALHEYSLDVDDISSGCPYLMGRYNALHSVCDENGIGHPTIIITEAGWEHNNVPSPTAAMQDIEWMNGLYQKPNILGAALWFLGSGFDSIANKAQRLIEPVTDFSLAFAPVPPPPEPKPEPEGECRGEPREPYPRKYWVVPSVLPLKRRMEIYLAAAVEQITVGPSYDDAGLGDLEDKTAVLFDIPPDQEHVFLDWFRDHYSDTKVEFAGEKTVFKLFWPTEERRVTQLFMARPWFYADWNLPGHEGLDMAAPVGSSIKACHEGIVYGVHSVDDGHPYGIHVRISHRFPDGVEYKTYYAHLESVSVRPGDLVKRGQEIGKAGLTGNTDGPHLHFMVIKIGATAAGETIFSHDIIDPTPFFDLGEVEHPDPEPVGYAFDNWEPGRFLAGIHARTDGGDPKPEDYEAIGEAKLNALKLLSSCTPAHIDMFRAEFHSIGSDQFVMARLFASFKDRVVSPVDFAHWVKPDMQRLYDRGVRYFEVHNEPNLRGEGYGVSWKNGGDFALWFLAVVDFLKPLFPEARFGFPGCSPGGTIVENGVLKRRDQWEFVREATLATMRADWIGVHGYWTNRDEMMSEEHGMGWKKFARWFADKLLLVTEFGNPLPYISKREKGEQYRDFYRAMSFQKSVGAAFSFCVSGSGWDAWTWVSETGEINEIAGIVGSR